MSVIHFGGTMKTNLAGTHRILSWTSMFPPVPPWQHARERWHARRTPADGPWTLGLLDTVGLWRTEKPISQTSGRKQCRHWILTSSQKCASSTRKHVGITSMPTLNQKRGTVRLNRTNTSICLAWSMTTPEEHACVAPAVALLSPETSRSASARQRRGSLHQIGACHSQRESFFLWPSRILQGVH